MTTRSQNTKIVFFFTLLIIVAFAMWVFWLSTPMTAKAAAPQITNFICQIQGKWSNEHYNIREANYQGDSEWVLTYRDSGKQTVYIQRRGEDCATEIFPLPEK